jgi:hypothetical protein
MFDLRVTRDLDCRSIDNQESPINDPSIIKDQESTMDSGMHSMVREILSHAGDDAMELVNAFGQ